MTELVQSVTTVPQAIVAAACILACCFVFWVVFKD